jgi:hypothetical protein
MDKSFFNSPRNRIFGYSSLFGVIYLVGGEATVGPFAAIVGVVASVIEVSKLWNSPDQSNWVPIGRWINYRTLKEAQGDPDSDFMFVQNQSGQVTISAKWPMTDLLAHAIGGQLAVIENSKFQIDRPNSVFAIEVTAYSASRGAVQIRRVFR